MFSMNKLKSVDFYRKIPRDLTEATFSGASLSILAAFAILFLLGMEVENFMKIQSVTNVVVDRSSDNETLKIEFNISFPALSCEFASVDVSDVLGTNRLDIKKHIKKYPIDRNLVPNGSEFHPDPIPKLEKNGDDSTGEELSNVSISLNARNFESYAHLYQILVVNFYVPWCDWSKKLKPSWDKAAQIMKERYNPETDDRILLAKVNCAEEKDICKRYHIQGYPSIRIFRKGNNLMEKKGHHEHESYYGERDTQSLVKAMEGLVSPISISMEFLQKLVNGNRLDDKHKNNFVKRPAPMAEGCRLEGFVRVKMVPGNLIFSAKSGAHSFDASQINMSHIISGFTFGSKVNPRLLFHAARIYPYIGRQYDALKGESYITNHANDDHANVTIEHYLQVVKNQMINKAFFDESIFMEDYEYTAHSSMVHSLQVPLAKFHFEISPMQVMVIHEKKSFSHFVTNACAIVGGIFTVAGIMGAILDNTTRLIKKKTQLGKNF